MNSTWKERDYFVCRTSRMLEFLRGRGFIPVESMPDFKNPKYYVWKFKQTPKFIEARDEWFRMVEAHKKENK